MPERTLQFDRRISGTMEDIRESAKSDVELLDISCADGGRGDICSDYQGRLSQRMTHAVMFHHFHGSGAGSGGITHPPSEGSLSGADFAAMLDHLDREFELLDADVFAKRLHEGGLSGSEICLTFDDSLRCQFDIALPELRRRGLRVFFFVYSSVFTDEPEKLEIYRDFRNTCFADVNDFHQAFFAMLAAELPTFQRRYEQTFDDTYLSECAFYSDEDRRFRWVRDRVLADQDYGRLMGMLMADQRYDLERAKPRLWMGGEHLRQLDQDGHIVGLHSHSHPTTIDDLDRDGQLEQYAQNQEILRDLTGRLPWAMSHPCGRYNDDTLSILRDLGITIGFRSSMLVPTIASALEVPREDHANVFRSMQ